MATPELGQRNLSIAECVPPQFDFLDAYQASAHDQIVRDENGTTIQGLDPRSYLLRGLLEELGEITEPDTVEPSYSRLGAIVLLYGNPSLQAGTVTDTSMKRHIKEFGDVSWYLANYLREYGQSFAKVIPIGLTAWHLHKISSPRSSDAFSDMIEREMPWTMLVGAEHELATAAQEIHGVHREDRVEHERQLLIAAGKFVTGAMHMCMTRFGITYEEVLVGNKEKLEKRIQEGTVFDKSGGDDR